VGAVRESAVDCEKLWAELDPLAVVVVVAARGACEARAGRQGVVSDPKSPKGARGAREARAGRQGVVSDPKSPKGEVGAEAGAIRAKR